MRELGWEEIREADGRVGQGSCPHSSGSGTTSSFGWKRPRMVPLSMRVPRLASVRRIWRFYAQHLRELFAAVRGYLPEGG